MRNTHCYLATVLACAPVAALVVAGTPADSPGYKTIEELYAAYQKATENSDWKALFLLGTPERQDGEILMIAVTAATSKDATLRSLAEQHGADWRRFDHVWTEEENRRFLRDAPTIAATISKHVRNKSELYASAHSYLAEKNDPWSNKPRELRNLVRHGATAMGESYESVTCVVRVTDAQRNETGRVTQTHSVRSRMWFRNIGGRWFLATENEMTGTKRSSEAAQPPTGDGSGKGGRGRVSLLRFKS